jgi:cytochrome c-type protein NapC
MAQDKQNKGLIGRLWAMLRRVGPWTALGLFVAGIVFWGGFNWTLELTNTERFCISCHEMRENVFKEYRDTIHYQNRTGVRATCPDCHVPKEWIYKIARKVQATNELWHHFMGTIDTPEKFRAKRLELAEHEWKRMKANDSRECRNCHAYTYMDYSKQARRANKAHPKGFDEGKTCIDCHKGIAHRTPDEIAEEQQGGAVPQPSNTQQ